MMGTTLGLSDKILCCRVKVCDRPCQVVEAKPGVLSCMTPASPDPTDDVPCNVTLTVGNETVSHPLKADSEVCRNSNACHFGTRKNF